MILLTIIVFVFFSCEIFSQDRLIINTPYVKVNNESSIHQIFTKYDKCFIMQGSYNYELIHFDLNKKTYDSIKTHKGKLEDEKNNFNIINKKINNINKILHTEKELFILLFDNNIIKYNIETNKYIDTILLNNKDANNIKMQITDAIINNNFLYITTLNNGVLYYDISSIGILKSSNTKLTTKYYPYKGSLMSEIDSLYNIFIDSKSNKYITTEDKMYIIPNNQKEYKEVKSINKEITKIIEYKNEVWVAHYGKIFKNKSNDINYWEEVKIPHSFEQVKDIKIDSIGNLWILSNILLKYNIESKKIIENKEYHAIEGHCLMIDNVYNKVWVGTDGSGIYLIDNIIDNTEMIQEKDTIEIAIKKSIIINNNAYKEGESINVNVKFKFDKDIIEGKNDILDIFSNILIKNKNLKIKISGFSVQPMVKPIEKYLGYKRAKSVEKYLLDKKVDPYQIVEIEGKRSEKTSQPANVQIYIVSF